MSEMGSLGFPGAAINSMNPGGSTCTARWKVRAIAVYLFTNDCGHTPFYFDVERLFKFSIPVYSPKAPMFSLLLREYGSVRSAGGTPKTRLLATDPIIFQGVV